MAKANLLRAALAAGTVLAGCVFAIAQAQEVQSGAVEIDLSDPSATFSSPQGASVQVSARDQLRPRFNHPVGPVLDGAEPPRRLELEVSAGGGGAPVDVSISRRASIGSDANLDQSGSGSELRIGRGLVRERQGGEADATYVFVASDNEALTWRPGSRSGALALQDQVQVGDVAAGVTVERNGVQASVAYVERTEQARVGHQTYSQDESFTGVTVTMRR